MRKHSRDPIEVTQEMCHEMQCFASKEIKRELAFAASLFVSI